MSVVAELAQRVRVSDPRPSHCAACFQGADATVRFVDFDAAIDRGQMVREERGVVHERDSIDDLHLCEACVRAGAEALALKPEMHTRHLQQIRRLELDVQHWKAYAKRVEATIKDRPVSESSSARKRRAA